MDYMFFFYIFIYIYDVLVHFHGNFLVSGVNKLHTQTLMVVTPLCGERLQGYGRRVLLDQPRKRFLDFFWLLAPPFSASSTLKPPNI